MYNNEECDAARRCEKQLGFFNFPLFSLLFSISIKVLVRFLGYRCSFTSFFFLFFSATLVFVFLPRNSKEAHSLPTIPMTTCIMIFIGNVKKEAAAQLSVYDRVVFIFALFKTVYWFLEWPERGRGDVDRLFYV